MKKIFVLTVRIDTDTNEAIQALARADDRSIAWVARRLIIEALKARKLLPPANNSGQTKGNAYD